MPVIKPRTRGKQIVRHTTRLDRENNETLYAYAKFIGELPEYILNQLIDSMLATDKEFVEWRKEHPESYVPPPVHYPKRKRRSETTSNRSHSRRAASAETPVSVQ
jgi:hypothetical protein